MNGFECDRPKPRESKLTRFKKFFQVYKSKFLAQDLSAKNNNCA
ncbi:unnamed protein product, partial [Allacma fusca]